MGCYSFAARDFHSLLLTGLRRRTVGSKYCARAKSFSFRALCGAQDHVASRRKTPRSVTDPKTLVELDAILLDRGANRLERPRDGPAISDLLYSSRFCNSTSLSQTPSDCDEALELELLCGGHGPVAVRVTWTCGVYATLLPAPHKASGSSTNSFAIHMVPEAIRSTYVDMLKNHDVFNMLPSIDSSGRYC